MNGASYIKISFIAIESYMCTVRFVEKKMLLIAVKQNSYNIIKKAVNLFNTLTCLKWLPYTSDLAKQVGHTSSVEFKSGG